MITAVSVSARTQPPSDPFRLCANAPTCAAWCGGGGAGADMYKIQYPAKGSPAVAARVVELLGAAGFPCDLEKKRGLDHGTFNLMHVMYPDADVPTIQLSMLSSMDPKTHLAIGKALAPLREEGVLICGSGDLTHTFGPSDPPTYAKGNPPTPPTLHSLPFSLC